MAASPPPQAPQTPHTVGAEALNSSTPPQSARQAEPLGEEEAAEAASGPRSSLGPS